jgi:hypothetical protein
VNQENQVPRAHLDLRAGRVFLALMADKVGLDFNQV